MLCRVFLCLSASLLLAPASQCAEPKAWKAGAARVDITPVGPMWMSGYAGRDKPAEGTLHSLWAKALVLEDPDGRRVALVTMDLVGIPRDLSMAVCAELKKKHGLPREAILLSTSHTHTGPIVGSNLGTMYALDDVAQKRVSDYATDLQAKLVEVVGAALGKLAPAQIAWGTGRVTLAVNRRNNKETDVPRLREQGQLTGPVDHDVPVLSVRDLKGKIRAVVFGYAAATVLSFYQWSGDYPASPRSPWRKCTGHRRPVLGRLWCRPEPAAAPYRRTGRLPRQLADESGGPDAPMPARGKLAAAYAEILCPRRPAFATSLVKDSTSTNRYTASRQAAAQGTRQGRVSPRHHPYPVQTWQLGPDLTCRAVAGRRGLLPTAQEGN